MAVDDLHFYIKFQSIDVDLKYVIYVYTYNILFSHKNKGNVLFGINKCEPK